MSNAVDIIHETQPTDIKSALKFTRRTTVASGVTHSVSDNDFIIGCLTDSDSATELDLPEIKEEYDGRVYFIKDEGGNASNVSRPININPHTGDKIVGYAAGVPYTIANDYGHIFMYATFDSGAGTGEWHFVSTS